MPFLNNATNNTNTNLANALNGGSALNQAVNNANISAPPIGGPYSSSASPNALPSSQIQPLQFGKLTRNIMHWFVPETGVISMYINPQKVTYKMGKLITPQRTKGGYIIQYWGEELTTIGLSGHTGSSGFEGLNVLQEIYRSEQLLFDPIAQSLATSNSAYGVGGLVDGQIGNVTSLGQAISSVTSGILSLDPSTQNIVPNNIPSLASMAFAVELYYTGLVYRGYFKSFSCTESVDQLGFFNYEIEFIVTQTRGYRTNSFAWQRSADSGPSNNGIGGVPLSFAGLE
jgi:hypothetical protein